MPSIEQISTWTIPEILQEIRARLTEGCTFVEGTKEGWYIATVQQTVANAEVKVLWSESGADRKILLLNAFGWLWLRDQQPKRPAWRPRTGEGPSRPTRGPLVNVPDPPDLDPAEIRAVYQKGPPKRK